MIRRYLLPLLLLFLSSLLQAATGSIPATPSQTNFTWTFSGYSGSLDSVANSWCASVLGSYLPSANAGSGVGIVSNAANGQFYCQATMWDGSKGNYAVYRNADKGPPEYTCPSGYTLNGTMCDPLSACEQVKGLINGTPQATRWYMVPVGSNNATGDFCDSGCAAKLAIAGTGYYTDGKMNSVQRTIMYTGQSCTNEPNAPQQFTPEKAPTTPEKKPPCAASEGVMTSSSGTIACVPEGTPNSNPPIVKKESNTKTNADGSKEITDTITTRDPSTGVEQKTSTTTTKDASGNTTGVSSSSGTSGATNGGNAEKPSDSDFCQKNPNLDICTGKLNKEETQIKIKDLLETAFKTDDVKNDDITNAKATDAQKQQATEAGDAIKDKLSNGTDAQSSQNSFRDLFSDWFEPIPAGGCSTMQFKIGAYTWSFDPCPQAEKISSLAGYALWIYLAFGTLALVTRKAE